MQYPRLLNNLFKHFEFFLCCFLFCWFNSTNVSHGVAKESMTWEKDGHRFICNVEIRNPSYLAKYLLVKHLHRKHDIFIDLRKLGCLSIEKKGPCWQDHASMNAQVLSNQFSKFQCNKQKAIAWAKAHAAHDWDQLQNDALWIKPTSKFTLVRLASSELLVLLGIPIWGVGSMPPNVVTKLKKDIDFVNLIWINKVFYTKGFKDVWDIQNWMKSSSKKEWEKEITLVVHYHEMEMVHGQ